MSYIRFSPVISCASWDSVENVQGGVSVQVGKREMLKELVRPHISPATKESPLTYQSMF